MLYRRMDCQNTAWRVLFQAGHGAPQSSNVRAMLPEADDEEIRPVRTEEGDHAIDFIGLDQMAAYLNGVSTPFGDGGLHEFFVRSLTIRLDVLRCIRSDCGDQPGIYGRWFNHSDRLQGCAKQLAKLDACAECMMSRWRVVIGNDNFLKPRHSFFHRIQLFSSETGTFMAAFSTTDFRTSAHSLRGQEEAPASKASLGDSVLKAGRAEEEGDR